jgi:uncharacterized protein
MKIEKEITVDVPPERVWTFLWDVERVARCLPGAGDVRTVVPHERYTAVVSERVGPFKVSFPLEIQVVEAEPGRRLKAVASGRDAAMGSALKVTLDLQLAPAGDGTRLLIASDANIQGKLGVLGHGIIQQRADGLITQFAQSMRRELQADAGTAV